MKLPRKSSKVWFLPPLVIAVVVMLILASNRKELVVEPVVERARVLRVLEIAPVDVVPRVLGYGNAEPGRVWRAVAEIKGRVLEVHPDLEAGALIAEGTTLLRIDATEYELQVAKLEASIEQSNSQIEELAAREESNKASLAIEERSLALAVSALERSRELFSKGSVAQAQVDIDDRAALAVEQSVQNLQTTINLIPAQRRSLDAGVAVLRADLERARLDLARAVIEAPFACRIARVDLEKDQFLAQGELLFEAHATSLTEIEALLPIDQIRRLLDPAKAQVLQPGIDSDALRRIFQVEVVVRVRAGEQTIEWQARFDRLRENIDVQTRSLGVIVAVDEPYAQAVPGERPPLVKGMFCEVELRGTLRKDRVFLPRLAVIDGHCYVLDDESRLRRRAIEVEFVQGGYLCVSAGLAEGDRVVVSDPTPAVEGMLVTPVGDLDLAAEVAAAAKGEISLR